MDVEINDLISEQENIEKELSALREKRSAARGATTFDILTGKGDSLYGEERGRTKKIDEQIKNAEESLRELEDESNEKIAQKERLINNQDPEEARALSILSKDINEAKQNKSVDPRAAWKQGHLERVRRSGRQGGRRGGGLQAAAAAANRTAGDRQRRGIPPVKKRDFDFKLTWKDKAALTTRNAEENENLRKNAEKGYAPGGSQPMKSWTGLVQ